MNKLKGHLSCFTAYFIFGFNIIVCKDLANSGAISPLTLFTLRAAGASAIFWLLDLIHPGVKVDRRDLPKIFAASMLGLFATQVSFLFGIVQCTPMDWALLTVLSPIITMFIAAIVLKEPITAKKGLGVAISFGGVVALILGSAHSGGAATTTWLGVLLALLNVTAFSMYLGSFRPLIQKYPVVSFMKWMFLFSLLASFPFTAREVLTLDYASLPGLYYWELAFLIIFSTVVAYFLIPLGQKHLRPTAVSLYSYLQPVIAAIVSVFLGMDRITPAKVLGTIAIVGGVILVNKSRARVQ